MSKICFKCKLLKDNSLFGKSNQNKDGLKSYCQECRIRYDSEQRVIRKSKNPNKYKELERDRKFRLKYGLTLKEYNVLCKNQNFTCKICGKSPENELRKVLFVDHNHSTGKIRGLLCNSCNKGLGDFKDSINNLEKAISYLKEFNN